MSCLLWASYYEVHSAKCESNSHHRWQIVDVPLHRNDLLLSLLTLNLGNTFLETSISIIFQQRNLIKAIHLYRIEIFLINDRMKKNIQYTLLHDIDIPLHSACNRSHEYLLLICELDWPTVPWRKTIFYTMLLYQYIVCSRDGPNPYLLRKSGHSYSILPYYNYTFHRINHSIYIFRLINVTWLIGNNGSI